jgi:hypothetical protein
LISPAADAEVIAERLVDAIGEALGVDTGTVPEIIFAQAKAAAARLLDGKAER